MAEASSSSEHLLGAPPPSSSPPPTVTDSEAPPSSPPPSSPAPDIEQNVPQGIITGSFAFGGDATHDHDLPMVKTKREDFLKWLWYTLVIKLFGRTGAQVCLSVLLSLGFLGLTIARAVYELPLLGDSSDWVKFFFYLIGLCFFSVLLGNAALINHELLASAQKFALASVLDVVHAGPQLINVAVLIRRRCETTDAHMRQAWATAAAEDIVGSLLVKLLFLPGLARIMYAIGLRGEDWHGEDPTEFLLEFDSSVILIQAALFSATELAMYVIRPSNDEHDKPPPIILNLSSGTTEPMENKYVWAVIITLATLLVLVTVITRPFIYLEMRNQTHPGLNDANQVDPAEVALLDYPMHTIPAFRRRANNANLDGTNDPRSTTTTHHDFTLADVSSITSEGIKSRLRAAKEKAGHSCLLVKRWIAASSSMYLQDPLQTAQIFLSCLVLGLLIFLVGLFASYCAYWTEMLALDGHNHVHLLGSFIFPATELLAFLPILRESLNGEFAVALVHSYRSAGLTFSLAPIIAIIAAKTRGRRYAIDLDTLQVMIVLGTTLVSVLTVAFVNRNSRLGHLLTGILLLVLMVLGPLLAWLLDMSAPAGHAFFSL